MPGAFFMAWLSSSWRLLWLEICYRLCFKSQISDVAIRRLILVSLDVCQWPLDFGVTASSTIYSTWVELKPLCRQ
ncbi:uncharacterized protein B0T23DRAFT_385292 [Neurospora hispaniola]|uniref:Secreted protein n=1 Tax=Neurospora hispaniola TaxID=588809 RepID=A0AAJ0I4F9_9PEZI|nr:hypothetical protein B0T23DRAFT_385292 [Neurospora hispaniola]